jgi:ribosomal protein S17E
MKKNLYTLTLGLILLISLVSSSTITVLDIKTIPFQDIYVTPISTGTDSFSAVGPTIKGNSDQWGDANFSLTSEEATFDLAIKIKKNGEDVLYEKYREDFQEGTYINLTIEIEGKELIYKPLENQTEESITVTNQTPTEQEGIIENNTLEENLTNEEFVVYKTTKNILSKMSGYVTSERVTSSKVYISIITLAVLIGAYFFIRKRRLQGTKKEIVVRKMSDIKEEKVITRRYEDELKEAQEALKKAQENVELVKSKKVDKIAELKKRIIESEKELMKLRQEEAEKTE